MRKLWASNNRSMLTKVFAYYIYNIIPIIHTYTHTHSSAGGAKKFAPLVQIFASYRACCYFCHFCFHLRFVYLFIRLPSSHRDLGPANGFCFRSCLALHNAAKKIIAPKKKTRKEKRRQNKQSFALEGLHSACRLFSHSTFHS